MYGTLITISFLLTGLLNVLPAIGFGPHQLQAPTSSTSPSPIC